MEANLASITQRLDALHPDQAVLRQTDEISELSGESKTIAKAETRALQARKSADEQRREAAARLAKVRPGRDRLTEADLVPRAARARVDELAGRKPALEAELRSTRKNAEKREAALAKALATLDTLVEVPSERLGALRAVVKSVPADLAGRIEAQRKQFDVADQKLGRTRSRYARFALPDNVADVAVPGEDEVSAHLKRRSAMSGAKPNSAGIGESLSSSCARTRRRPRPTCRWSAARAISCGDGCGRGWPILRPLPTPTRR